MKLNYKISACELLQLGASKLVEISKSLKNPFWKQVLGSAILMCQEAAFSYPEKIIDSPFFHNPLVVKNRVLKPSDFPEIQATTTLAKFFHPNTNTLMQWNDFCTRYDIQISEEKFINIRYIIKTAVQKLKISLSKLNLAQSPTKPFLIDLVLSTNKGCSQYYKVLTKKSTYSNKIHLREAKWHPELNTNFWSALAIVPTSASAGAKEASNSTNLLSTCLVFGLG